VALGGIFVTAHGLIGTLAEFFAGAKNDSSILYRTHDYPVAEAVWRAAPWFGHGPGSWRPTDELNIFDNQWLDAVVELGAVGVVVLFLFLVVPAIVALAARRASADPDLRVLCGALAGAGLAAPVVSATFDSMAFPLFVNVYAMIIGLTGACVRLVAAERGTRTLPPPLLPDLQNAFHRLPVLRPRRADS
jgi:O-antigen ligase